MTDVFDLTSKILNREVIVKKFSEWWSENEIKEEIIPNIVDEKIKGSIQGALKNFDSESVSKRKSFAEILYGLVGQNFLVNPDKVLRANFLDIILKKKYDEDETFQKRFSEFLIQQRNSNKPGICNQCKKRWSESDNVYYQTLGLDRQICCSDYDCASFQQKNGIKNISESGFIYFLMKFQLSREYRILCKRLIDEFEFPEDVMSRPTSEMKLLPESIVPLGEFSHLYNYQSSIGLQILDMLENYEIKTSRGLVVLPTGAGKTRLVVETLIEWINSGKKGKENSKFIIWIVDKTELCQQAFDTFAEIFRHRGKKDTRLKLHPIYSENEKNIRDLLYQYSTEDNDDREIDDENGIIIASIASLYSLSKYENEGSLPELGKYTSMVIIDEAHHAIPTNISYTQVLRSLGFNFRNVRKKDTDISKNQTRLLGITATPFRGKDQEGKSTNDLLNRFGGRDRILWPPFSEEDQFENTPPIAHVEIQKSAYQDERVKIYGEKSYDKDGKISAYQFTISKLLTAQEYTSDPIIHDEKYPEKNIEWTFENPGRYSINLKVIDDEGYESNNLAMVNIEILPKIERENKNNVEEMKKLYKHLIKKEILARPHHYIIDNSKIRIDLDDKKDIERFQKFHDITKSTIRAIGNDPFRNKKIIDKIISLTQTEKRKSILLFACSIQHAKYLSFVLDAIYGIKSASIDNTTSTEERDQSINDFRTGKISVLCNYDILTTGFDAPKVECVFIARPTFSHLLYNQMAGRGLRGTRSNGTSNCIIVDVFDNIPLVIDDDEIEQPWKIFEYIYETVFEEAKIGKSAQKCYGCFGIGQANVQNTLIECAICKGTGSLSEIKEPIQNKQEEKDPTQFQKYLFDSRAENPRFTLEQHKIEAKRRMDYDRILNSNKDTPKITGPWSITCVICKKESNESLMTMSKFGTSDELKSEKNPNGVFQTCKECRAKEDSTTFEHTKCPKCGKEADGEQEIEKLFGFRIMNGKKNVQSWCFDCR